MAWIFFALIAHIINALVFIIDKGILDADNPISQPLRLTAYTGILSGAAVILLPFQYAPPSVFVLGWSTVSGSFFLAALWWFFSALKIGESSRVVPMIGSVVPLFTLLFATVILGEELSPQALLAVMFLIAGGALLSIRLSGTRGLSGKALLYICLGGAAFAAHFSTVKFVYDGFEPFLAAFAYSRIVVAVISVVILWPLLFFSQRTKQGKRTGKRKRHSRRSLAVAFVASKSLGTGAFLLQNYAINLGSVTVVNALQGTQYMFVLLLAVLVSVRYPRVFREELQRVAVIQKVAGIVLISLGLVLLL
ncbi:MAG: EamA family transporter [Candidatus Andersenbacteria bacterium]